MTATDARPVPRKNVAFRLYFALRDGAGNPIINWPAPSGAISKDGGTPANTTNTPTEITPLNTGAGYVDLTSTEMDCDAAVVKLTASTSIPVIVILYPEEIGDYRARVEQISTPASGDIAAAIWEATLSDYDAPNTSTGHALVAASGNLFGVNVTQVNGSAAVVTTSADIADAVWEETLSDHVAAGSTGHALVTASGNLISDDLTTAVWSVATRQLTSSQTFSTTGSVGSVVAEVDADVTKISGSATAANNAEVVFATDFSINYNTTRQAWATNVQDFVGTTASDPFNGQLATPTNITGGTITTVTNLTNAPTVGDLTTTMKASVRSEADDALTAIHLDHLLAVADADTPVNNSIIAHMVSTTADWSTFIPLTDALESIRNGLSTPPSEADIWSYANRSLTNLGDAAVSGDVAAAIWDTTLSSYDTAGTTGHALVAASGNLFGVNVIEVDGSPVTTVSANDIADAVWDEQVSEHVTTGSASDALIAASGNLINGAPTEADIWGYAGRSLTNLGDAAASGDVAGAIWNAATASYGGAGTYGQRIEDGMDTVDLIWTNVDAYLDATVSSCSTHAAADVWTAGSRTLTNIGSIAVSGDIAHAVWDEPISGHTTTGTAGDALITSSGNLISGDWGDATAANQTTIIGYTDEVEGLLNHSTYGLIALKVLLNDVGTSGMISQAVWEHASRSLTDIGAAAISGQIQDIVEDGLTAYDAATGSDVTGLNNLAAADVWGYSARTVTNLGDAAVSGDFAAAIWNADMSSYDTVGTTGHTLVVASGNLIGSAGTAPTADAIANAVWDEQLGEHLTVDSAGYALGIVGSGIVDANMVQVSGEPIILSNANDIADAVWDESVADHTTTGTTGDSLITASGNLIGAASTADIWSYADRSLTALGSAAVSGDLQQVVEDGLTAYDAATGGDITGLNDLAATDVWTYADRTLTGVGDAATSGDFAAAIWSYAGTRALTTQNWSTHDAADVWAVQLAGTPVTQASIVLLNVQTNVAAIGGIVQDIGASGMISQAVWEYGGTRALTTQDWSTFDPAVTAVSVSGIPTVNVIQVSGELVTINDFRIASNEVATSIWNASLGSYTVAGTFGEAVNLLDSGIIDANIVAISGEPVIIADSDDIANAVWDEQLGEHLTVDSAGYALGIVGSGIVDANMVQVSGEYVSIGDLGGDIDTTGLATTAQLEYWGLVILNNCGGGPVG